MDIEIDFECRECGWVFARSFLALDHGKALKCPFCSGASIKIRSEVMKDDDFDTTLPEASLGERMTVVSKIKL